MRPRNARSKSVAYPHVCCAIRNLRRTGLLCAVLSVVLVATGSWSELRAQPAKAKIVGLGATTCQRFSNDVRSNPVLRRDYMAWAQGFMSAMLLSRPAGGVDVQLDLIPVTFDLINQLHFLEDHCARNPSLNFSDAVEALYKRLRNESKT